LDLFHWHLNETVSDYFKQSLRHTSESSLLYGDFLKNDDRVYQPLSNWKQLESVLSEYQMRSNMSGHATKQIVFFKKAIEHVCRACRVLRQPNGHMLLIGLDGTGKSTVMELASFISNCDIFKLNIKKGYAYADFRDDLKSVFKLTAVQKKKIVLFIADKDVSEELFLEDLDSLLTTGNIPDLFDVDELDSLFMELKKDALMEGITDEKSELYRYLIRRVQLNLHLVLSMSPVGAKFRERCRFHPALLNCTTIDWYDDWSEHAMKQVSMSFMESIDFK
jgi:dynein heavy chain